MLSVAIPGQYLGNTSDYQPGPGTHVYNSKLYASILGPITKTAPPVSTGPAKRLNKITSVTPTSLPILSIDRNLSSSRGGAATSQNANSDADHYQSHDLSQNLNEVLPEVNRIVLCRVSRITPKQATVSILVVGETVLNGEWQGLIRVQDVRATEKDKVKIFESFRPGDIVRATVVSTTSSSSLISTPLKNYSNIALLIQISLGDQSNYYLSTASNHLGVIMAISEAGNTMYPVSWKEYRDPETGVCELRKVAKPF